MQTLNNAKGQLVRQGQLVQAERSRAGSAQQHAQTLAAEARKAQTAVQRQHDADMAQAIDEATRLRVRRSVHCLGRRCICVPCPAVSACGWPSRMLHEVRRRHVAGSVHIFTSC